MTDSSRKRGEQAPTSNIVEKHGLTQLLNHVLAPEFVPKRFQQSWEHDVPWRSGFDLAPHARDVFVEGKDKVWREVDDAAVERVVDDVRAHGYGAEAAEDVGSQLLDTRMLWEENEGVAVLVDNKGSRPKAEKPKAEKPKVEGKTIKLKLKMTAKK